MDHTLQPLFLYMPIGISDETCIELWILLNISFRDIIPHLLRQQAFKQHNVKETSHNKYDMVPTKNSKLDVSGLLKGELLEAAIFCAGHLNKQDQ